MNKFFLSLLAICLPPLCLSALPVGNPAGANMLIQGVYCPGRFDYCDCLRWTDLFSLRAGYYGDYVYDRKMEIDANSRSSANLHRTKICTNAGYIALNFFDRIDLYSTLGASFIEIETPQSAFLIVTDPNANYYIDTNTSFSYTVGADAALIHLGRFVLGIDGKYFYTRPKVNAVRVEEGSADYIDARLKYTEWQVSGGISYIIPISCWIDIVPYGAFKWARAKGDFDNAMDTSLTHTFFDIKNWRRYGYAIGVTLAGCAKWNLTIEGRFYDELAFDFNTQFRF
jgi:major outer membrane protein